MFLYRHRAIPYLNPTKATAGSSAPSRLALVDGTLHLTERGALSIKPFPRISAEENLEWPFSQGLAQQMLPR